MEATYLHDLHAEGLEPGQEPVQGGLISQWAVQDSFDRLHRGTQPLEVKQGFRREDPDDADLVVGRWQRSSPQLVADGQGPRLHIPASGSAAPHALRVNPAPG
jgi:hypothetical protein